MTQEIIEAAREYLGRGWSPVELHGYVDGRCTCGNDTKVDPETAEVVVDADHAFGKHPVGTRWQAQPLMSAADVYATWQDRCRNVGIRTGTASGFWVLDVDPKHMGTKTLELLELEHAFLPTTYSVRTPSGGWHYYFALPDFRVGNSPGRLGPGLDVRGEGGQVAAPPSIAAGGPYVVASDVAIVPAPEWLLDLIRPVERPPAVPGQERTDAEYRSYGVSALERTVAELLDVEVDRNHALNRAAFRLGQLAAHGCLGGSEIIDALTSAALAIGLEAAETRKTTRSGFDAGMASPREPWPPVARAEPLFIPFREDEMWPMRTWDDLGNAERLADHYGNLIRYVEEAGRWAVYEDGVWSFGRSVAGLAHEMIRMLPETEAHAYDDSVEYDDKGNAQPSQRDRFLTWVGKQRFATKFKAMLAVAADFPQLRARLADFDADPWLLNCTNGVVDLRSGRLLEHSPTHMMMMRCPVAYDPLAPATRWQRFLDEMQPDPEHRNYLQRCLGYSLTGLIREQAFFIHFGGTMNGKSVCFDVCGHVLGDYNQVVPKSTLMLTRNDGSVPNDVARMMGKRLLQASETTAGRHLDEEAIKGFTGGEKITARFMRAEFFDFTPTGKIHLATNHKPVISNASSIWRRMHLIEWPVTISLERKDDELAAKIIRDEAPGVLAWLVRGCLAWQERGLDMPATARAKVDAYREDEDLLGAFVRDCCVLEPGAAESNDRLYDVFSGWCIRNGIARPWTKRAFVNAMRETGRWTEWRTKNVRGWSGLRLVSPSLEG